VAVKGRKDKAQDVGGYLGRARLQLLLANLSILVFSAISNVNHNAAALATWGMPFCHHLWQGSCRVGFVDIIIRWSARADFADQR